MAAKGGRPKKELDAGEFERLCAIQCTEEEICMVMGVSDKTLARWCAETYGVSGFSEAFKKHSAGGKMSLRRAMFNKAVTEGSVPMMIWLSKQYLGMRDFVAKDEDAE